MGMDDDEVKMRMEMLTYLDAIEPEEIQEVLRRLGSSWLLVRLT